MSMLELLTASEMRSAETLAIDGSGSGLTLMERAGGAVTDVAVRMLTRSGDGRIVVLCGPGSNGGDGFVAARLLAARGHRVELALHRPRDAVKGEAAQAAAAWHGAVTPIGEAFAKSLHRNPPALIIDALFGIGLTRPITGALAELINTLPAVPVLAVDVPSGVDSDSGAIRGTAIRATETVTFGRRKPGHLLYPGRAYAGAVTLAPIGIPDEAIAALHCRTFANRPALWCDALPRLTAETHKYARGWVAVLSGPPLATGAARLAAAAALSGGAGLVTLHGGPDSATVLAQHETGVMIRPFRSPLACARDMSDPRVGAIVIGPALGLGDRGRLLLEAVLPLPKSLVLDADALTLLARHRDTLMPMLTGRRAATVLTPHAGEFARLFGAHQLGSRLAQARAAAIEARATVVLKGADTVIAASDGTAAINDNAPPELASAGTGDVLAGLIGSYLAQGAPAFAASAAAVWQHGAAAVACGPTVTADRLIAALVSRPAP